MPPGNVLSGGNDILPQAFQAEMAKSRSVLFGNGGNLLQLRVRMLRSISICQRENGSGGSLEA